MLGIVAALAFGPAVLADSTTGSVGNYLTTDTSVTPGATCQYPTFASGASKTWLSKVVAKPPSIWWPDRSSDSNTEHGKVGWRFLVQFNNGGPGWTTVVKSSVQKAIAYEDSQSPYNPSTKAPLTKMSVGVNAKATGQGVWRVVVKAFWYKKNGTKLGSATHVVQYYRQKIGSQNFAITQDSCSAYIALS
jgi:hypothetical protein